MPFAATWMDLEIIMLSQEERQIYAITSMWNLKYNTNDPIYETETDSETERIDLWLPRARVGQVGSLEFADVNCYMQNGQRARLYYKQGELFSISCEKP